MTDGGDEAVSKWAVFKPFRRPLVLNLLVPCLGVTLWYGGFEVAVGALDLAGTVAADSVSGQVARTKATVAANVVFGLFVGGATVAAYGWHVWNILLGAFFAVNGGDVAFWVRGTAAPAEFYRTLGYAMSDAEFVRILSLVLSFVVPAMAVFGVGMTLCYRTPERQLAWWTRLPK